MKLAPPPRPPHLRRLLATLALAAAALLALAPAELRAAQSRAYVVTTDFGTGGLSWASLDTRVVTQDAASIYRDARARWSGGLLYVLNRLGADNLQVIDPAANFATVHQFSLGNGSNPSDIVLTSPTRAYVALYQRPGILIMNPQTGATLGNIDLSAFADADGLPEPDHIAQFGRWLLVSLERLDEAHSFVPTDSSLVAVIDAVADTVVDVDPAKPGRQAILLSRTNPNTAFAWDPLGRRFYLGCVGKYGFQDGGVVAIDPATWQEGIVSTEAQLGGDIADIEWHTATHGYAIVTDVSFQASLVSWNPATGARTGTLFGPVSGLSDCGLDDRGELYVCDNSFDATPGLRVFSAATDLALAGPLPTGLPPFQVLFDGPTPDALGVPRAAAGVEFTTAGNPARSALGFTLRLDADARASVELYDVTGRRTRTLVRGTLGAGEHRVSWDLRDDAGRRVAPGVYLARAAAGARHWVTRVTVLE